MEKNWESLLDTVPASFISVGSFSFLSLSTINFQFCCTILPSIQNSEFRFQTLHMFSLGIFYNNKWRKVRKSCKNFTSHQSWISLSRYHIWCPWQINRLPTFHCGEREKCILARRVLDSIDRKGVSSCEFLFANLFLVNWLLDLFLFRVVISL